MCWLDCFPLFLPIYPRHVIDETCSSAISALHFRYRAICTVGFFNFNAYLRHILSALEKVKCFFENETLDGLLVSRRKKAKTVEDTIKEILGG